jgi:hypothetical protein
MKTRLENFKKIPFGSIPFELSKTAIAFIFEDITYIKTGLTSAKNTDTGKIVNFNKKTIVYF